MKYSYYVQVLIINRVLYNFDHVTCPAYYQRIDHNKVYSVSCTCSYAFIIHNHVFNYILFVFDVLTISFMSGRGFRSFFNGTYDLKYPEGRVVLSPNFKKYPGYFLKQKIGCGCPRENFKKYTWPWQFCKDYYISIGGEKSIIMKIETPSNLFCAL